ncbi:ACL138Cp [Eremothecium gossypii ATCC 10895]|uniref:ACL138Cp n=1 Tax=Eremothecium gossypii (strain ATCC 10895 / CBS 109.51 / FGSC 9923 / NRRL Y-1056) TaxID=284811 RepID=Q75CQ7_EREGS|nr:ACL138Cp [Eremothecium gossypii ATCC 10895]AAS51090.1 ACL138Cp [Eremothecium gossypii ATCC 10895]
MRRVTPFEEFYYRKNTEGLYSCFFVGVTLNVPLDRAKLEIALRKVVNNYPQLYSNVFYDDMSGDLCLRPLSEKIYIGDVLGLAESDKLDEDASNWIFKNINFKYHCQCPLWKIVSMQAGQQLLFCFDHLILDGMSGALFWEDVLRELNSDDHSPAQADQDGVLYFGDGIDAMPAHPYSMWPSSLAWKILRIVLFIWHIYLQPYIPTLGNSHSCFQFKRYTFPECLYDNSRRIRNTNRHFSLRIAPDQLKQQVKWCREHNTSLTAWFAAIITLWLKNFTKKSSTTGSVVKVEVPFNTRQQLSRAIPTYPKSALRLGLFVKGSTLQYNVDNGDEGVWKIASEFSKDLGRNRDTEVGIQKCKLLELVDVKNFVISLSQLKYPPSTFEITNLGFQAFGTSTSDTYYVTDAVFRGGQTLSNAFTCYIISTPLGGCHISLSLPPEVASDCEVDALQLVISK